MARDGQLIDKSVLLAWTVCLAEQRLLQIFIAADVSPLSPFLERGNVEVVWETTLANAFSLFRKPTRRRKDQENGNVESQEKAKGSRFEDS